MNLNGEMVERSGSSSNAEAVIDPKVEHDLTPSRWSHRLGSREVLEEFTRLTNEGSAKAKSSFDCQLAVPYDDGHYRKIDIFGLDSLPPDAPILLHIHGGFWQEGSRELSGYPALLAVPAGIVYIALGYDLAPFANMPNIVESVNRAMTYVCKMAQKAGGHSRRVYVFGFSAGAHLAAMTLLSEGWHMTNDHSNCAVEGVLLVSGVYDVRPILLTSINQRIGLTAANAREFSPQDLEIPSSWSSGQSSDRRIIVAYAQNDSPILKRQSIAYSQKLTNAGVNVTTVEVPDTDHFSIVENMVDAEYSLAQDLVRMIHREHSPLSPVSK